MIMCTQSGVPFVKFLDEPHVIHLFELPPQATDNYDFPQLELGVVTEHCYAATIKVSCNKLFLSLHM